MDIDSQIAAITAAQGALPIERRMLDEAFCGPPAPTSTPGVNATKRLALADRSRRMSAQSEVLRPGEF